MARPYWHHDQRSFKHIFEKYHMLINQHINGRDLTNISEASARLNKTVFDCDGCVNEIYMRFDVLDMKTVEEVRFILKSKRNYKSFRFMCYNSKEITSFFLKLLELIGDTALTIDICDGHIQDDMELELNTAFPAMKHFRVSSCYGDYQEVFIQPYSRYETLSFEHLLYPVDLKTLGVFGAASKKLYFLNTSFTNFDTFNYFQGYCKDFCLENNRRSDYSDMTTILKKSNDIVQLVIKRKRNVGFLMNLHRDLLVTPETLNELLFSRRTIKRESLLYSRRHEQPQHLENEKDMLMQRRSVARLQSVDESDDTRSIVSNMSESNLGAKENFDLRLEVYSLTWPLIEKLVKLLDRLTSLTVFEIPVSMIEQLFRSFKHLQAITVIHSTNHQTKKFERKTFSFNNSLVTNPIRRLPKNALNLCLQHFDFDDFTSASLVSKRWNEVFGVSKYFMKKAVVKLNPSNFRTNYDKICISGSRNYETIEVNCRSDPTLTLRGFKFVHAFSAMLVELSVSEFRLTSIRSVKDRFIFNNLRTLKIHNSDEKSCFLLLQNCVTIKSIVLSSISISESIIYRLRHNNLRNLSLVDCNFDYFETIKQENARIDLDIYSLGLIFDRANAWKVQESAGFNKFLQIFLVPSVRELKVSSLRGEHLLNLLNQMKKLRKLSIQHIWESDLRDNKFNKIREGFQLCSLTFGMGENVAWCKFFPSIPRLFVHQPQFKEIESNDKQFKKMLRSSADKLLELKMYKSEKRAAGYFDPIIRVPDELHQLMFQHFSGKEILNTFEVSKTWNNFCKESGYCARKYSLYLQESYKKTDRELIIKSSRKYFNIITDYYHPKVTNQFENVRKLSIRFFVPKSTSSAPVKFNNLETLIITKCPAKFYNPDIVAKCFRIFSYCENLKFLEICESITPDNVTYIWDMLEKNKYLKTLKIEACSEFFLLFSKDISSTIKFRLTRLNYEIPQRFKVIDTDFEQNVASFLSTQDALKILDMKHVTIHMMKAIFKNMKQLEVFRLSRVSGNEPDFLEPLPMLREFMFPNIPTLPMLNSNTKWKYQTIIDAIPNVELLYFFTLTTEMVESIARNLKKVRIVSADRYDGPDCERFYYRFRHVTHDVNRYITFKEVKFNLDGDDRSFEQLFGNINTRRR